MSTADDLRALLNAVLDAIDIPAPATGADLDPFRAVLDRRASLAVITARGALAELPTDIGWNADYLRRKLAECPATGYHALGDGEAGR